MSITWFALWQLNNLSSTWSYYTQLVDSISPTITFLYNNVLTEPIFYWIIITCLVVSFFSFWSE